jgi:transcription initiation factor TFIID subunit 8
MAPMALEDTHLVKRTSTEAEFDVPFAKKQNRGNLRHHKPVWDLQRTVRLASPSQDEEKIHVLLTRSLALALEVAGFEGADPTAMESFRAEVEECRIWLRYELKEVLLTAPDITQFLADVRLSMLSCRRIQPIPQDFLYALQAKQLSLNSLIPQLHPLVPPDKSQFSLDEEPIAKDEAVNAAVLRRILKDEPTGQTTTYIPPNFPAYPSQHTFKSTPVYSKREEDPRKIRELAMEEGRLAEQAIRRLLSASSGQISADFGADRGSKKSLRAVRDEIWKETMLAVGTDTGPCIDGNAQDVGGRKEEQASTAIALERVHLSSAVNSDKQYWRKSATVRARAEPPSESHQHK